MQPILSLAPAVSVLQPGMVEDVDESFDLLLGPEDVASGRIAPEVPVPAVPLTPLLIPPVIPTEGSAVAVTMTAENEADEAPGPMVLRGVSIATPPPDVPVADASYLPPMKAESMRNSAPGDADLSGPARRPADMGPQPALPDSAKTMARGMVEATSASPLVRADEPAAAVTRATASAAQTRLHEPSRGHSQTTRLRVTDPSDAGRPPVAAAKTPDAPDYAARRFDVVSPRTAAHRQGGVETNGIDRVAASAPRTPDLPAQLPYVLPTTSTPWPVTVSQGPTPAPVSAAVPLAQLHTAVVSAMTGGEGLTIDLSPADLGRMRIEVPSSAGAVEVRLIVERADTLPLVQRAAESLADDLRQAGIMAQSVTVELLAPDRSDPVRADLPRAEPGGQPTPSGGSGTGPQDRPGAAGSDSGAGSYRGSGTGQGRDSAVSVSADQQQATAAERLDLRL